MLSAVAEWGYERGGRAGGRGCAAHLPSPAACSCWLSPLSTLESGPTRHVSDDLRCAEISCKTGTLPAPQQIRSGAPPFASLTLPDRRIEMWLSLLFCFSSP